MFAYGAQPPAQDEDDDDPTVYKGNKGKQLPFHGNRQTMNLNPLILTNIQGSPYYKVELFKKRAFLEVVDEIYYKVDHLEPWERGSRGGAGMRTTGMCGGVRGVSAGGIVSSAFCLLYKLFTLKLTEKQAECLINHQDSPYIRGLGFMYLRFTQPPGDLWDWFEPYLDDQEQIDVKAGGGKSMAMGDFLKLMMTKLEWFDTRFPRIPATVEKMMRERIDEIEKSGGGGGGWNNQQAENWQNQQEVEEVRNSKKKSRSPSKSREDKSPRDRGSRARSREKDRDSERRRDRSKDEDRKRKKDRSRERDRSKERKKRKDRSRDRSRSKNRSRSKDRNSSKRKKDRSRDRSRESHRSKDSDRKRGKDRSRDRSRSKDRDSKRRKDRSRSGERSKKVKSKRDRSGSRDRERKNGREEDSEYADQLKRFKKLKRKEKERRSRSR